MAVAPGGREMEEAGGLARILWQTLSEHAHPSELTLCAHASLISREAEEAGSLACSLA